MDLGLSGKKALICGASKGLGYACAEALYQEGCDVYLLGREQSSLEEAKQKLAQKGSGKIAYATCDLVHQNSRQSTIKKIQSDWNGVDILIHNVGGPKASTVQDTAYEDWEEGFQRLFLPVVDLNQAFLPAMKQQKWGRIITVTSLSVIEPIPMLAVSTALRSASTALSKALADEVGGFGVTVNCVAPGMIHTDRTEELMEARLKKTGQTREQYQEELKKSIPAGRMGTPDEYAAAVCFIASAKASYINGVTIFVDGGKKRSTN